MSLSNIGHGFSDKVVQKPLSEKNIFNKKWSPKRKFSNEKKNNSLCKYDFGTLCQTVIHQQIKKNL